jgi:hypothetical protein
MLPSRLEDGLKQMKRFLACILVLTCAAFALSQAPFTIVRPADGSKVREDVHILFPKNSIPDGGYVGIFVNGKFIEATLPTPGSKFLDYTLATKTLNLPDGPTNIEAVLYVDFQEKPRIVDRSSIQVTVANKANIPIPDEGIKLRYRFQSGREWIYKWDTNLSFSTISESQAHLGGHAAELPVETRTARLVYAMDNVYADGDALLRMQIAPPAGKNSMVVAVLNNPQPKRFFDYQMYPLYMRVHSTGMEVYGSLPPFFTFAGSQGGYNSEDLVADYPLPTLPTKAIRPGDTWQGRFQLPTEDFTGVEKTNILTEKVPARGEFVGLEWEMGYPCAKIHHSFSVGSGGTGEGANNIKTNAQSIDETFWFALDRGTMVKMIRTMVIDRKANANDNSGTSSQGPAPNNGTPARAPRRGGKFGGVGGGVVSPGGSPGIRQAGLGEGDGPPAGGAPGAGGNAGRNPGPPAPPASGQLFRITFTEIYTLQK